GSGTPWITWRASRRAAEARRTRGSGVSDQSPEARFDGIAARLLPEPGVELKRAFHNPGLTAGGRIFAMLVRGEMVVKLPAERCAGLVAAGAGRPFDRGQGRPLREW